MSTPVEHGVDPKIWGPPTWQSLYYILSGFDPREQTIEDLHNYFANLNKVLPCSTCRGHFKDVMAYMDEYHPIADYAKEGKLKEWFTIVREEVRKNEGKPFDASYSSGKWGTFKSTALVVGAVAVGAGLGYYLYQSYQRNRTDQ